MRAFGNTDIGCTRKVNEDDYCILQNEMVTGLRLFVMALVEVLLVKLPAI